VVVVVAVRLVAIVGGAAAVAQAAR
jgi:hypothetical protein